MLFNGKLVVFGKGALPATATQLNLGKSDLQLFMNAEDAKRASIPSCILKKTGRFERNVIALDARDERVELATFGTDSDDDNTVTLCSAEELASVVKLVFEARQTTKAGSKEDQQAALDRFTITIASAPVATK